MLTTIVGIIASVQRIKIWTWGKKQLWVKRSHKIPTQWPPWRRPTLASALWDL